MATEQYQQIERTISKVADKFPVSDNLSVFTDIHLRANQETGELTAFDDDDCEITRTIIDAWIDNKDEDFYTTIQSPIRKAIENQKSAVDNMSILKPFSFVLENDEKEHIAELYIVDDDIAILDTELLKDLDDDLNDFLEKLLK